MIISLVADLFGVLLLLVVIYFLGRPIVKGAIYFPTTPHGVENMLKLADVRAGQKIVDLGSGDGRIVIALAQRGVFAEGYEINPILVLLSRRAIRKAGVQDKAKVYWKSFWRVDLSRFDAVIVYGIPYIMKDLQKKLVRELQPGTKVISNAFSFPGWKPVASQDKIRLYVLEK